MNNIVTIALISFAAWLVAEIFRQLNTNKEWFTTIDRAIEAIENGEYYHSCDAIQCYSKTDSVLPMKYKNFLLTYYSDAVMFVDRADNIWLHGDYCTLETRVHMLKRFRETL